MRNLLKSQILFFVPYSECLKMLKPNLWGVGCGAGVAVGFSVLEKKQILFYIKKYSSALCCALLSASSRALLQSQNAISAHPATPPVSIFAQLL